MQILKMYKIEAWEHDPTSFASSINAFLCNTNTLGIIAPITRYMQWTFGGYFVLLGLRIKGSLLSLVYLE